MAGMRHSAMIMVVVVIIIIASAIVTIGDDV